MKLQSTQSYQIDFITVVSHIEISFRRDFPLDFSLKDNQADELAVTERRDL